MNLFLTLALHTCEQCYRLAYPDPKTAVRAHHKVSLPLLRDPYQLRSLVIYSVHDGTWHILTPSIVPHHGSLIASSSAPQLKTAVDKEHRKR